MREPDFHNNGWCLDDGETRHAEAPDTFWIPDRRARESLQPGDLAKLMFRISVAHEDVAVESMWVVVRERTSSGYLGILDNDPYAIAENDEFWSGTELPFSAKHVINIEEQNSKSVALAREEPRWRWQR